MARIEIVGTKRAPSLLGSSKHRGTLEVGAAVDAGLLHAEKVERVWAYSTEEGAIDVARGELGEAINAVCNEWLLVPMPIMTATARKRMGSVSIDLSVAQALVRERIRYQEVGSLPLLTDDYLPYFALYSLDDQDEIDRYVETLRAWTHGGRAHRAKDLPSPLRERTIEAWRDRILLHGEFLGLGHFEDGSYIAHSFDQ